MTDAMYTKLSKIVLVWAVAFYVSLVVFNNVTDYGSNFAFVSHVLTMDTTFPDNRAMWRAIESPAIHHVFYGLIILVEATVAFLCWAGGYLLVKSVNDAKRFNRAKGLAICGLTLGIILWFTGFMTVGGEWFLMWQSEVWNGQNAAFRLVAILGIVLLYLVQPDEDASAG